MKPIVVFFSLLILGSQAVAQYGINPPNEGRPHHGNTQRPLIAKQVVKDIFALAPIEKHLIKTEKESKEFVTELKNNLVKVYLMDKEIELSLRELRGHLNDLKTSRKKLTQKQLKGVTNNLILMTWILAEDEE